MLEQSFIIILTRKCFPCGCDYCNVLKKDFNDFRKQTYKDKNYFQYILKQIKEFLDKNNISSIRFFWGEVFLEKKMLIDFISYIRKIWFNWEIFINTNLHLFKKEDLNWIKEDKIRIITSLNWDENLHCKTRWIKEKDYYKLLENIKYLIDNKVFVQINTVLFPYEKEFITKINQILDLNSDYINLLPLMYSPLLKDEILDDFWKKLEELLLWIKENNLQNKFLNFQWLDKFDNFPLVKDDLVLDSDGNIYSSMLVLESFFNSKKELLFLSSIENLKKLEIENQTHKINLWELLINHKNSISISNLFTNLLLKNKKWEK